MKFSVPLSEIIKPLQEIAGISSASAMKNKDDITQNILIEAQNGQLTLRAMNYVIELEAVLPLPGQEKDGAVTVNSAKLRDSLKNLNAASQVIFDHNEEKSILTISSESTSFEIRTRSALDFPTFEREDVQETIVLKQKQLKAIIDASLFCISNEDFRDYLKGMRFEADGTNLAVFTSDGHRMAILDSVLAAPVSSRLGVIITKICASELSKIIEGNSETEVRLQFTKNAMLTSCNAFTMASKLINCGYPNVRSVIPKEFEAKIVIPKHEFTCLIRQVSVLSSKKVNGVTFTFHDSKVDLRSENSEHEVANASLPLNFDYTKPYEISLNAGYVIDVLNAIQSEEIVFCFSSQMLNVMICPNSESDSEVKSRYIISKIVV